MTGAELVARTRITAVWSGLGGGVLRTGRGRAFWRSGDGFSVSLDDSKGTWYDHARGEGGGVLDLIGVAQGCSRADALRWLAALEGVELDTGTLDERRRVVRMRTTATDVAVEIEAWRAALMRELDKGKADALLAEDWGALEAEASLLHRIQNGAADVVLGEFRAMRQVDPARVRRLIAAGREDWLHAGRVCGYIVALMARGCDLMEVHHVAA